MSPAIRHKYIYFHSTVQRAKDRRQKFHFCRLPFDVRPRNVKLKISLLRELGANIPAAILTSHLVNNPYSLYNGS